MPNLIVCTWIYRWKEIYREGSDGVEKRNHSLITFLHATEFLDKIQKGLRFLSVCHGLRWEDRIPYSMMKRLIIMVVIDTEENDNKSLIYIKGFKKTRIVG